jgi:hypothetical protein
MLMEKLKKDIEMAQNVSSRSSFFVFDNKYAVSELNTLKPLKTLEKVWEEGDFDQNYCIELSK